MTRFASKSISRLHDALMQLSGKTLITFQEIGDVDAVSSAIVLSQLLPESRVRATGQVNAQARLLLKHFGLGVPVISSLDEFDNVVVVDAGNAGVLGAWGEKISGFKGKLVVIDHHTHSKPLPAFFYYCDKAMTSTCEIIFELSRGFSKARLGNRENILLAAGIISDTAFFKSANDHSFQALAVLLQDIGRGNSDYEKVVELIQSKPDISEKLSRLKAIKEAQIVQKGKFVAGFSFSDGFELSCASAMVDAGCDFAVVGSKKHGRVFAVRADWAKGNVGKFMETAGRVLGGSGGGHEKVGGANGAPEKVENAVAEVLHLALQENAEPSLSSVPRADGLSRGKKAQKQQTKISN